MKLWLNTVTVRKMEMGEYAKLVANEETIGGAQRGPPHPGQNTSRGSKIYILVAVSFGLLFIVQSALNVSLWLQAEQNTPCCPSGWQSHESTCYQLSSRENTWQHAKEDCETKGSHLVILNDAAEEKVVRGFEGDAKLWMGLSGYLNEQKNWWYFTSVDSIGLCYGNWKKPTPTVASNIYCVYVDNDPSYLKNWFRVSCEEQHKWMCEMKRASIPK